MPPFPRLFDALPFSSSTVVLLGFAALGLLAGLLYATGALGLVVALIRFLFLGSARLGFFVWRNLLSWASWYVLLLIVSGLLAAGIIGGRGRPILALTTGIALMFVGISTCLAYVLLDLERFEVARGYKALRNPLKGQELAENLVHYGHRVGIITLIIACLAVIGGFVLSNEGLYETIGTDWYRATDGQERLEFDDFLSYTLLHLFRVADLLHVASSYNLFQLSYVEPKRWPASTLLTLFKSFFTLVLLQQVFASVRRGRLLAETITDFWSPHPPIYERARGTLLQYGPGAAQPLLQSVREVSALTTEQREHLPHVLADLGPAAVPSLRRRLQDPNEHVRGVAVAALGYLHALDTLPALEALMQDESEWVRICLVEALGDIIPSSESPHLAKQLHQRSARPDILTLVMTLLYGRSQERPRQRDPLEWVIGRLRAALADPAAAVRSQAARSLGKLGVKAAAAAPDLIRLLQDPDEEIRRQVAWALGQVGGPEDETIAALRELLLQPSPVLQEAAAEALGDLKSAAASAVPDLVPLLQNGDEKVRQAAGKAIGQIGTLPEEAIRVLVHNLASPDNVVRARTAEALGLIGSAAAAVVPALSRALSDENDRVRAKAVGALGKMGEAARVAVPGLVRALRDPDNLVRALAAEALGEIGESATDAIPALVRSLHHTNPLVRANAAEALGKMGEGASSASPALSEAARDPEDGVRRQAVLALGEIGDLDKPAQDAVLAALRDDHPEVRAAAVEVVSKCEELHPEGRKVVLEAIGDASDLVKVVAPGALVRLKDTSEPILEGLSKLLRDDNPAVQVEAALALGRFGEAASPVVDSLLEKARTGAAPLRMECFRALARIQPPQAVPVYIAGLKDTDPEVRKLASACLLKAPLSDDVLPQVLEALRDPEPRVRANVAQALARFEEATISASAEPEGPAASTEISGASPESKPLVTSIPADEPPPTTPAAP
jgi:HEAT repeat protein